MRTGPTSNWPGWPASPRPPRCTGCARLKESGVIRIIRAQLDPEAAGFPLQLYVFATLGRHDPRATRIFEDQIRALPQIIAADNVAGEMDYLLSVVARDVAELSEVLTRLSTRGGQRLITYLRLAEVNTRPAGCRWTRIRPRAAARRGSAAATRGPWGTGQLGGRGRRDLTDRA